MKLRLASLLSIIGIGLVILSGIWITITASTGDQTIPELVDILGNILICIFFTTFFIKYKNNTYLKNTGLIGMIGQILYIIELVLAIISIIFMRIYMGDFNKNEPLLYIATAISWLNLVLLLISLVLLSLFFIRLYRYLDRKGTLKNAVCLALTGEIISLALIILGRLFFYLIPRILILHNANNIRDALLKMSMARNIIGLIPLIFLAFFFITFYRVQTDNNDPHLLEL